MPTSDASVSMVNGVLKQGMASMGALLSLTFNCWKAASAAGFHLNGSLVWSFLSKAKRGAASVEYWGTNL